MKKSLITLSIISCISFNAFAGNPHWGYEGQSGPEHWGKLSTDFSLCGTGENQSPINIDKEIKTELKPLQIEYKTGEQTIINNGHTVQIDVMGESTIIADGDRFQLKQFHFHTPSENLIYGKSFPMEVHFVHANKDGKLLVLAVMFNKGQANAELADAWEHLSANVDEQRLLTSSVDIEKLLPKDLSYYRFNGSLTTPPCSEGVRWFVLKHPISASSEQINKFESLMGHHNNRPVQQLNARVVVG